MVNKKTTRSIFIVLVIISLLAASLAFYATRWGAWALSDSAVNLKAGENIATGKGYGLFMPSGKYKALTRSGPVFPGMISILYLLHIDPVIGIRWLDIVFFFMTTLISGWLILENSPIPWFSIPVSLLIATFPIMLSNETGIMTEPPFLFLIMATFFNLFRFLRTGQAKFLFFSAILTSLAILTRYLGLFLLVAGCLCLIAFTRAGWKDRNQKAIIYGLTAFIPVALWVAWSFSQPDSESQFGSPFANSLWDQFRILSTDILKILWHWAPVQLNNFGFTNRIMKLVSISILALILFLGIVSIFRLYGKHLDRWTEDHDFQILSMAGLGLISYLGVFSVFYLFSVTTPDVDNRTLLPVYPLLILAAFSLSSILIRSLRMKVAVQAGTPIVVLLALLATTVYLPKTLQIAAEMHQTGMGYVGPNRGKSEIIRELKNLPLNLMIISNDTGAILFYTGRMALEFNERFNPKPVEKFVRYGDDPVDASEKYFKEHQAVLAVFEPSFFYQIQETYDGLAQKRLDTLFAGLTVEERFPEGAIYLYP